MKKLIIHETDCHGCGTICYDGHTQYYAYDDEMGDLRGAVNALIDIGFIDPESVEIFDGNRSLLVEYDKLLQEKGE